MSDRAEHAFEMMLTHAAELRAFERMFDRWTRALLPARPPQIIMITTPSGDDSEQAFDAWVRANPASLKDTLAGQENA